MIQDIFPNRFDNTFVPNITMEEEDYIFLFDGSSLLLKQIGDKIQIPKRKDITTIKGEGVYLFSFNGQSCFWIKDKVKIDDSDFVFHEVRSIHTIAEGEIDFLSGAALHIKSWYEQHRYCGKCGSVTEPKADERALVCSSCGHLMFTTISPAIIVAIISGDHILLAHNVNFPEGLFSLVAGYVDVGETVEQTVIREVHEEVGVAVGEVDYYKSQPWSFTGSLMLAFVTKVDKMQDIKIDNREITAAAWYHRDNLPNIPGERSIAGEIIRKFRDGEL